MRFFKRFRELNWNDFCAVLIFPFAYFFSFFYREKNKKLILICESENEARDNGYWLFKYICHNHPEQRVCYAIKFSSPDYDKVRELGECVNYGSFKHWLYYLSANINASSQKGGKPNAALFYVLEVLGILKNKRVFLQHGITISDAKWLYYSNTKLKGFICGAKPEYNAISKNFGYPSDNVKYLGFSRFDQLHNLTVNKKQILLMPSWREWLVTKTDAYYEFNESYDFRESEYFKCWNAFLSNIELLEFLEEKKLSLVFYPHRNLQRYLHFFENKSANIIFASWKEFDIQTLLKESAFLITDYSSVFMDFAYMKKPMLFYQFDYTKFRKGQYQEGYFSYANDGFGKVCYSESEIVPYLKDSYARNFTLEQSYLSRIEMFFPLNDTKNSERIYTYLKEIL